MGNGYTIPTTDETGGFVQEIQSIRDRLAELERPSGVQNGGIPDFAVNSGSNSAFVLTTSAQNLVSVSFTVPPKMTRALVVGSSSTTAGNNSDGRLFSYVVINGSSGPVSNMAIPSSVLFGTCAAFHSRTMTVTPGSAFTVDTYAYFSLGSTPGALQPWSAAALSVSVIYL